MFVIVILVQPMSPSPCKKSAHLSRSSTMTEHQLYTSFFNYQNNNHSLHSQWSRSSTLLCTPFRKSCEVVCENEESCDFLQNNGKLRKKWPASLEKGYSEPFPLPCGPPPLISCIVHNCVAYILDCGTTM